LRSVCFIPYTTAGYDSGLIDVDLIVTGCIRPRTLDSLVPTDPGGQYVDEGSEVRCNVYKHFVEVGVWFITRASVLCLMSQKRLLNQPRIELA
jgi:hypothetical protein